jgi:hypothetical protein
MSLDHIQEWESKSPFWIYAAHILKQRFKVALSLKLLDCYSILEIHYGYVMPMAKCICSLNKHLLFERSFTRKVMPLLTTGKHLNLSFFKFYSALLKTLRKTVYLFTTSIKVLYSPSSNCMIIRQYGQLGWCTLITDHHFE